jgi:hypothetical protein
MRFACACLLMATLAGARDIAHVLLLGGQSNMQGIAKLAPEDKVALPGAVFWDGKGFEPLDLATTRVSLRPGEFGPELGLVRRLRERGVSHDLHLVKFYRSGQPLDAGFDSDRWLGPDGGPGRATFWPGAKPGDPHVGRHYQAWLAQCRAALAALRAAGKEPKVIGIVWVQGEADAKHEVAAGRYPASLRLLRSRLCADLGISEPPLVYAQVLPAAEGEPRFVARDLLRRRLADLDAASGHADATPGFHMTRTDGFGCLPDKVHFDRAGQLSLGAALADALLGGKPSR